MRRMYRATAIPGNMSGPGVKPPGTTFLGYEQATPGVILRSEPVRLGCFKMHFHPLIKAIVFPSVPLGEPMNVCDFRRILRGILRKGVDA